MRTSALQFQLLVDFMERHGDLSKPTEGSQGRATNIQLWAELTQLLNADATGDTKTAERWRKEEGTDQTNDVPITIQQPLQDTDATVEDWFLPGTSTCPAAFPPLLVADRGQSEPFGITESGQPMEDASQRGLTSGDVPPAPTAMTPFPQTPRRRRRGRLQEPFSPVHRRTRTQTQSDLARQTFARSDMEWRAFQQETERERNRLRQEQLAMQERWLELFRQLLLLGNRIVDIVEKKNKE